jgi:hypothetical protein
MDFQISILFTFLCKKPVAYKFDDCSPGWRKLIGRIGPNNEWECVAFVREMQELWHFWVSS